MIGTHTHAKKLRGGRGKTQNDIIQEETKTQTVSIIVNDSIIKRKRVLLMKASQLTFLDGPDLLLDKKRRTPGTDTGDKCAVTKPYTD